MKMRTHACKYEENEARAETRRAPKVGEICKSLSLRSFYRTVIRAFGAGSSMKIGGKEGEPFPVTRLPQATVKGNKLHVRSLSLAPMQSCG